MVNRLNTALREQEKETYYTLPQLIALLGSPRVKGEIENTSINFLAGCDAGELEKFAAYLKSQGFERFKILGAGRYSLVLELPATQTEPNPIVVRLSLAHEMNEFAKNHQSPAILLPIAVKEHSCGDKKIRIEIKHKLATDRISEEQERELEAAIHESGITARDVVDCDNSCRMVVGSKSLILLLDPGVVESNGQPKGGPSLARYINHDGRWMQELFDPRLRPGRIAKIENLELREQMEIGRALSRA